MPPLSSPTPNSANENFGSNQAGEIVAGSETSLAELADLCAARLADPELAADLALQIVLNEIAEQVCSATGATGAAVALLRAGELACRASSGSTAPELGSPASLAQGLAADCVRTRTVQVCSDMDTDPRTAAGTIVPIGAKSALMRPIVRDGIVVGVLEAFSSRRNAFEERDVRALESLGQRVVRNMDLAEKWTPARVSVAADPDRTSEVRTNANEPADRTAHSDLSLLGSYGSGSNGHIKALTYTAAAIALVTAVVLWARIGERLGWLGADMSASATQSLAVAKHSNPAENSDGSDLAVPAAQSAADAGQTAGNRAVDQLKVASALPPGTLAVYDNGREVFRVDPYRPVLAADRGTLAKTPVRQAVSIEREPPRNGEHIASPAAQQNLLRRVEPDYPEEAQRQKIQGPVVLDVRASENGLVQEVKLISGNPLLAAAAIAAVNRWQFKPQVVNGQATHIETTVTLDFKLAD